MIQFYKANPRVTGAACSFWVNADGTIMASMIKQHSWDDNRKTGSFLKNKENPKGRVIIKLGPAEVGGMIDTIESNRKFSTYHSSQNQVLQINFSSYIDKKTKEQKGFSFGVNKQDKSDTTNKVNFIIGFSYPEARYLKEYLKFVLNYGFSQKLKEVLSKSRPTSPTPSVEQPVTDSTDSTDSTVSEDNEDDFEW